tara:strand:+ start:859 stop:1146 length:288 start_codon:yes stop_codon:yes gene_type:complete
LIAKINRYRTLALRFRAKQRASIIGFPPEYTICAPEQSVRLDHVAAHYFLCGANNILDIYIRKTDQEKREGELIKRMLNTPPQPRKPIKEKKPGQ